jgi:hypothetical protein
VYRKLIKVSFGSALLLFLGGFFFTDGLLHVTCWATGAPHLVVFSYPEASGFQFTIPGLLFACVPLASILYVIRSRTRPGEFSLVGYVGCLAISLGAAALGIAAMLVDVRLACWKSAATTHPIGLPDQPLQLSIDNLNYFRWGFAAALIACVIAGAFFASRGPGEPPRNSS